MNTRTIILLLKSSKNILWFFRLWVNLDVNWTNVWRFLIRPSMCIIFVPGFSQPSNNALTLFEYWCIDDNILEDAARHGSTTSRSARFLPVEIVLTGWFWQTLPGYEVHHGSFTPRQSQCWQGHVPVKKSSLVYQPQDLSFRHRLILPLRGPVVKDKLCDISSALTGTKQILLRLPAYQNQS